MGGEDEGPHLLWGTAGAAPFTPRCPRPQLPTQKAKRQQMDMIAELKKRQMVKEPLIYEGKDGAIEDIISGERLFQVRDYLSQVRGWVSPLQQSQQGDPSGGGCGDCHSQEGPPSPMVGSKPICSVSPSHAAKLPSSLCPVSWLFLLFCFLLPPPPPPHCLSGSLCSALKTVPFTARTGKRSSRLFCDVSFNEESPL